MNIKKCLLGCAVVAGFLATPLVYANDTGNAAPEHGGKSMHKWHEEIYAQLNLTDDQKKQLEDNKQKNREQKKVLFGRMKSSREALRQEFMKPDLDMNKVNAIQAQIKTLLAQMSDNRLNSVLTVRKILTPEQFKKFHESMAKHAKTERHEDRDEEGEK